MKRTFAVLLGLSLLANAGLFTVLVRSARNPAPRGMPKSQQTGAVMPATTDDASATATPRITVALPPPAPPPPVPPAKLWEQVRSDDARQLAARLREAGVPDSAARLLVSDTLRAQYLARQGELLGSTEPAEFWKAAAAAADREKQAALRRLARDHQDLLTELYGANEITAADRERQRRLYGPLPDEKLERVDRIHADYGDMADDIRAQAGGLLLATDRETLALLDQERRKDVAAILTPAELELYDLQTAPTARALRARLAAFAPTEKEFRALFALQRAFDERFGSASGATEDVRASDRAAAEAEMAARIKTALGDARYEEFRRQQDPGYRVAARIAERFGLPAKRAAEVYSLSHATQTKLQAMRDDKTLAPDAVRPALVALGREAGEKLAALLGSDGADLYKRTSCGAWLRALERVVEESAAPVPAKATAQAPTASATVSTEPATASGAAATAKAGEGSVSVTGGANGSGAQAAVAGPSS